MVQQLALRAVDRAHRFRHEGASRADFRAIGTETPTHRTLRTCLRTSRGSAPRRPAAAAPAPRRTREGQAPPLQLASRQGATHPRAALASPSTPSTQDTTNDASAAINSHDRSCSTAEALPTLGQAPRAVGLRHDPLSACCGDERSVFVAPHTTRRICASTPLSSAASLFI